MGKLGETETFVPCKKEKRSVRGAITEFQLLHLKGNSINLGSNFPAMTLSG